jgi:hypothetical protein
MAKLGRFLAALVIALLVVAAGIGAPRFWSALGVTATPLWTSVIAVVGALAVVGLATLCWRVRVDWAMRKRTRRDKRKDGYSM